MIASVTLHAAHGSTTTLTGAEGLSVTIDGRPEVSGQLLGVAVAGCYANTLLAKAASRGIWVRALDVAVEIEWVENPLRTRSVTISVEIATDADDPTVTELVEHADRTSEVANSIRLGVPVRVANLRIATSRPSGSDAPDL